MINKENTTNNSVTIGEVCDAIEVLVRASKSIPNLGNLITDSLYGSQDDDYLKMLNQAGGKATNIFLDRLHD